MKHLVLMTASVAGAPIHRPVESGCCFVIQSLAFIRVQAAGDLEAAQTTKTLQKVFSLLPAFWLARVQKSAK